MSVVNVTNVKVGKNPASTCERIEMEVSFESLETLEDDLEWRMIYVGSADSQDLDQELDYVALGPIKRGALQFVFSAPPPDFSKIPADDILGITVVLLKGSYRNQEFIRIGWYVHNVYTVDELNENPPEIPVLDKMARYILTDEPRVTRFNIDWDKPNPELRPPPSPATEGLPSQPSDSNISPQPTQDQAMSTGMHSMPVGNHLPVGMSSSQSLPMGMSMGFPSAQPPQIDVEMT